MTAPRYYVGLDQRGIVRSASFALDRDQDALALEIGHMILRGLAVRGFNAQRVAIGEPLPSETESRPFPFLNHRSMAEVMDTEERVA